MKKANQRTEKLVSLHWDAIEALGIELYVRRKLNADQIAKILKPYGLTVAADLAASSKPARQKLSPSTRSFIVALTGGSVALLRANLRTIAPLRDFLKSEVFRRGEKQARG